MYIHNICIYIYIYIIHKEHNIIIKTTSSKQEQHTHTKHNKTTTKSLHPLEAGKARAGVARLLCGPRKGTNEVNTNGVTASFPKVPGRVFVPIRQKSLLCSDPIGVDPILFIILDHIL